MKLLSKLDSLDNVQDGSTRKLITKTTSSGNGNAVTSVSVSGDTITYTKGTSFLTSHQSAFSNVKVGSSTVAADQAGDTLELVAGSNVTLTPDTTNTKVTIAATDTDTKNTAGSTNSTSKMYLIGATSQADNPQTYSNSAVYATNGKLIADSFGMIGVNSSEAGIRLTNGGGTGKTNMDMGWDWNSIAGSGAAFRSSDCGGTNDGQFLFFARKKDGEGNAVTCQLQGTPTGILTWGGRRVVTSTNGSAVGSETKPVYINSNGYATVITSYEGNAETATKLQTARTIGIGTGGTGTATSFDGSGNITIPLTDVKDSYVTWGGKNLAGSVSPDDMGCIDDFGHNKLAYLPAGCIKVEYTNDGGTTWQDYGLTDAQKIAMVTTSGPAITIGKGTVSAKDGTLTTENMSNFKVRVTISTRNGSGKTSGNLYTDSRKWLINASVNGATCKCLIEHRTIDNYNSDTDTWATVGDYNISGWSGWNSIPYQRYFGGSSTQTSQIADCRFTLYLTGIDTRYKCDANFLDFRLIGATNWGVPSTLARYGHLYSIDTDQNALFPGHIYPKENNSKDLGSSNYKWANIYTTDVNTTNVTASGKITSPKIETGTDANNYFQSQKFRGQGDASSYYHAIDFGYSQHDRVDFYEYGGIWNFWKNTTATATSDTANQALGITLTALKNQGNTYTFPKKDGTFALISDIPTNIGTITGVSVNGTSVATSGVANITSMPASILTGAIPSAVTATTQSASDNSTKIATTAFVKTAIDNLPEPMVFKGTLGTGGTITALPVDGSATIGDTYKVITAGTYASKAAKVGDTFICLTKTSTANTWELIPSGDEPSGTVTSIKIQATSPIAIDSETAITTSGTRTLSHANSGVTAGTYRSVTVNATGHVTAGTNPTTLSGYGITDAKIASGVITLGSNTITPLTASSTLDATKLSGTIPSGCYTNTTYTFETGDSNGQIKVTPSGGSAQNISVKGLGTAAYTASSDYAVSNHNHFKLITVGDNRAVATKPNDYANNLIYQGLKNNSAIGNPSSATYSYLLGLRGWTDDSGGNAWELAFNNNGIYARKGATTEFGSWNRIDIDTKNTAGSTDTSSKIYLIGATSQAANPQTYSDNEVYATSGVLTTKSVQVGGTAATMQYNSTDKCIEFVFA